METIPDLAKAFSSVNQIEDAAQFLLAFVKVTRTHLNPRSKHLTLEWHLNLLKENTELHKLIMDAHKKLEFEKLDEHALLNLSIKSWRQYAELSGVQNILDEIDDIGRLRRVADGEDFKKIWQPRYPDKYPDVAHHIKELKVPTTDEFGNTPCLVLHNIGSYKDDPVLRARIDNIFHSKHTFLVNASGTGKTRLLFEGLCIHWGLFFTATLDIFLLGSKDMYNVIHDTIPNTPGLVPYLTENYQAAVETNSKIVRRRFNELLLSRLIVFKLFLEYSARSELVDEHKRRWLSSQLSPRLWSAENRPSDYFIRVWNCIKDSGVEDANIEDAIMHILEEILDLGKFSDTERFYIIVDEANHVARKMLAFRDRSGHYGILKEIIRAWKSQLAHLPISLVISGTFIPKKSFRYDKDEWKDFKWCSDTGAFDSPDVQRRYVSQFIPKELAESAEGQHLIERIWKWIRGRHRFTAGFVNILLQTQFQNVHVTLNDLIETSTKYQPKEGMEYPVEETDLFNKYYELYMDPLSKDHIKMMMHEAIIRSLCHFQGSVGYNPLCVDLVTESLGRFLDSGTNCVAVDEPLNLIAAAKWFTQDRRTFMDLAYFKNSADSSSYQCKESHKVDFLAVYLAIAFDQNYDVCDIFKFPGYSPIWTRQTARLIYRSSPASFSTFNFLEIPRSPLITEAKDNPDLLRWIEDHSTPFCAYHSDGHLVLLFALQLEDGDRFWVALQLLHGKASVNLRKLNDDPLQFSKVFQPGDGTSNSVIPDALKALPSLCQDVGTTGALGVVASLNGTPRFYQENRFRVDYYSIAGLQLSQMQKILKNVTQPQQLIERVVSSVISPVLILKTDHADVDLYEDATYPDEEEIDESPHVEEEPTPKRRRTRAYARVEEEPAPKRPRTRAYARAEDPRRPRTRAYARKHPI